jgi:hypothetical protein
MALGAAGGCSSTLQTPRSDAGRDTATSIDRPIKPTVDASGKPDARDGGIDRPTKPTVDASGGSDAQDGGAVCTPLDVANQCANNVFGCQPTWTDVMANPFCTFVGGTLWQTETRQDCSAYHIRQVFWTADESSIYYYDVGTGMLVAIYLMGDDGKPSCVGGPPGGISISGPCSPRTQPCLLDGGMRTDSGSHCEAGLCLDGGSHG